MTSTIQVKAIDGTLNDVTMLSPAEIDAMLADVSPPGRKKAMEHMKLLGRPVTELMGLDAAARKAFILGKYAEFGGVANGKKPGVSKAVAAPAAATKAVAGGKVLKKPGAAAAVKAVPQNAPDDDDDTVATGGDSSELAGLLAAQDEKIDALSAAVEAQAEVIAANAEALDVIKEGLKELMKIAYDTHFIVRVTGPMAAGITDDDILECAPTHHSTLLAEVEDEAEGNG